MWLSHNRAQLHPVFSVLVEFILTILRISANQITNTYTDACSSTPTYNIVTCQAHPVLVKTGQMYGLFLVKKFL